MPTTAPDTGSAREDLLRPGTALVDGFLPVEEVVRRGEARGELRADVDPELVRDLLFGPLVHHWPATDRKPLFTPIE